MVCRYCRQPIGFINRFIDKEFCCKQHRTAFSARSARALRELGEFTYSAADVLRDTDEFVIPEGKKKSGSGSRSTATVLGLAALSIGGLVIMDRMGVGEQAQKGPKEEGRRQSAVAVAVGSMLDKLPKSSTGIAIEDRFNTGLRSWLPAPGSGPAGWKFENGLVRPGGLRIWDESRNLGDYTFEFEGKVESNSLGWVVRAPNHRNYYASKLIIPERNSTARPEIVRFSVVQGQESRRLHLPVPVNLEREKFYQYEVKAVGDRILTLVGGRVVDQWRDARFRTGGVGFFNERGDKSAIRWAKLNEGESMADKLRRYLTFGLIVPIT
ncbi:MAG: hypothetical protein FJW30_02055 [Acidobacteria bacterium]|nr:hypothetical protein [Acidobacteriota bacterium]